MIAVVASRLVHKTEKSAYWILRKYRELFPDAYNQYKQTRDQLIKNYLWDNFGYSEASEASEDELMDATYEAISDIIYDKF